MVLLEIYCFRDSAAAESGFCIYFGVDMYLIRRSLSSAARSSFKPYQMLTCPIPPNGLARFFRALGIAKHRPNSLAPSMPNRNGGQVASSAFHDGTGPRGD